MYIKALALCKRLLLTCVRECIEKDFLLMDTRHWTQNREDCGFSHTHSVVCDPRRSQLAVQSACLCSRQSGRLRSDMIAFQKHVRPRNLLGICGHVPFRAWWTYIYHFFVARQHNSTSSFTVTLKLVIHQMTHCLFFLS